MDAACWPATYEDFSAHYPTERCRDLVRAYYPHFRAARYQPLLALSLASFQASQTEETATGVRLWTVLDTYRRAKPRATLGAVYQHLLPTTYPKIRGIGWTTAYEFLWLLTRLDAERFATLQQWCTQAKRPSPVYLWVVP